MTFWSVPPLPGTTSSVNAGEEFCLLQFGTAAMLICLRLGALPCNLTVPLTDPALSVSTCLPDGLIVPAANIGDVLSRLFPPQLLAIAIDYGGNNNFALYASLMREQRVVRIYLIYNSWRLDISSHRHRHSCLLG